MLRLPRLPCLSFWKNSRQRQRFLFSCQWRFVVISTLNPFSHRFVFFLFRPPSLCVVVYLAFAVPLFLHCRALCVLAMSVVRRFDPESPEELVLGRREGGGCSDASSDFCATSSSSIGRDSDVSGRISDDEKGGGDEVQSHRLCVEPLDMMESLEEALPLRRGISMFYDGKCKSFTTLLDAASTCSSKEIAKSENAYSRKRRNLLAFSLIWEKNRTISRRNTGTGISKRPIRSSRSTLALAVAMSSSDSISSQDSNSRSPPLRHPLPITSSGNNYLAPLIMHPPCNFSTCGSRSISVTDLQH